MSVSELSASSQNYLKSVWSLQEWSDEPVTPSRLAAKVGVKMPTASDAVRKLTEQGLLEHAPYGAVTLTPTGRTHAVAMIRRHRLIETFLVQVLGYRWDQVHDEAETLEHAVSDFMVDRIDALLEHPDRDPHGDPIPAADGAVVRPDAARLTDLAPGTTAVVERIADDDAGLLQFFTERGIGVGSSISVRAGAPYSGAIDVLVGEDDAPVALGDGATDAVWVRPAPGLTIASPEADGAAPAPAAAEPPGTEPAGPAGPGSTGTARRRRPSRDSPSAAAKTRP
ncbi:metal-dependent transcriptional regulator [Pseudoclavibacter endophyticus]|uniref:Manganese transport regulator n=1 Tax=Pseudoclavibacter endophyticus TaxID=1778590 RepID=A0A6H9WNI7_9MICO|nr:metal-dependent transcriptional regulator [Pseudoclavibacter endophyticus]KAB1649271.1 metal-dependent transcriptional regulator [Pseudoclavibacter endophyticus]